MKYKKECNAFYVGANGGSPLQDFICSKHLKQTITKERQDCQSKPNHRCL